MKRHRHLISILLILTLVFSCSSTLMASNDADPLAPYREAISVLNEELGSHMKIPTDEELVAFGFDKNEVYENILKLSVSQFTENLRQEYIDVSSSIDADGTYKMKIVSCDAGNPFLRDITTTQTCYLDYGSVYLTAQITNGVPHLYTTVYGRGSHIYTDRTHFRAYGSSSSLINGDTQCKCTYTGTLFTASGVSLTVVKKYTVVYTAGGGNYYMVA